MRTFGVEEELILVDEITGMPVAACADVLDAHARSEPLPTTPQLVGEMQQEMVETVSRPCRTLDEVRKELLIGRARADQAARAVGARAVALGTSPLAVRPHPTRKPRYDEMMRRYGATARSSLTCGFHVHVGIDSPREGVAVLDRIRGWLPVLLALSANSPFESGADTAHSSYRYASWSRWPQSGPLDVMGSLERYRAHERRMLGTGVLMDPGMLYFDARLSRHHPTVEVRIMDVCLCQDAAAGLAALVRGMVEQAARDWHEGRPPLRIETSTIRLAGWKAALGGLTDDLVDPTSETPRPAAVVVASLLRWATPALRDCGDLDAVATCIEEIVRGGNGADWQRASLGGRRPLSALIPDVVAATHLAGPLSDAFAGHPVRRPNGIARSATSGVEPRAQAPALATG